MANIKGMQEDAMASIDTAKALIDKVITIMGIMESSPSLSLSFATNPIGFLLQLLKHLGIGYEDIRLWLVKFLIYVVPVLEISVKAILLTNLKKMVSCSVDPRIPDKFRKRHKEPNNTNTPNEYGIDISIESIDLLDKLSVNPLSDAGSEMYFGLEGVEDVYKFVRADDFDAFLWFVIHKGKFPTSSKMRSVDEFKTSFSADTVTKSNSTEEAKTFLAPIDLNFNPQTKGSSSIFLGNTFAHNENKWPVSMCIDAKYDENNQIIKNTIVPVSDDWTSVNWYARQASQFGKNLGFGWSVNWKDKTATTRFRQGKKGRNYSKEKALCNLQYIDQSSTDGPLTGLVNNKLRFTILPKPMVHTPDIAGGEPPWRFKRLLFDCDGNYDGNGKYTVAEETGIEIDKKSGKVMYENNEAFKAKLFETYKGLTVYEFNYDFVMSIKLFDAKVLATSLLDSLIDMRVGINLGLGAKHQAETEILKEIIKNIINTDDSAVSDCFYSFDNSKYDELLRKAEQKRAKKESFGNNSHSIGDFSDVKEILKEYDANGELHEQIDILGRVITQASVNITEGLPEKDKFAVEYNFVFDLIENLVMALMKAVLSPKVLLLLEVNQKLMGGTWEKFTLEDLIRAMSSMIKSIVKEVRDLVIQELLKLLLSQLQPIIAMLSSILLREQLENYADAITEIIRNCPFIWFKFGNRDQETKLDTVDYADIDVSEIKEGEKPELNNC